MWDYRASVSKVIDGDTLDLIIDVGFHMTTKQRVRLLWVDTPEMRGPEREDGKVAKLFVENWVDEHSKSLWPFVVHTEKDDAFGRWLCDLLPVDTLGQSLSSTLLNAGQAELYK